MPDVKWYAGGPAGSTFSTTITPTANNGAALGTAALSWSDLFLASGAVINFNNGDVTLTHGANLLTLAGGNLSLATGSSIINEGTATNDGYWLANAAGAYGMGFVSGVGTVLYSNSIIGLRVLTDGSLSTTAGTSVNIGNAATVPASNYLVIGGVSGAGGTPTTAHVTAGSGAVIYVQQAHDAQATKFVIAYNNYNGINYLVGTLDGTTATWTNSTTRP